MFASGRFTTIDLMADWRQLATENLLSAGELMRNGYYRSSVNRAYYAAFSAAASQLLERGLSFSQGRSAPSHEQLPRMVRDNLGHLSIAARRRVKRLLGVLYLARVDADYRPSATIRAQEARDALNDASTVLKDLGVTSA